MEQRALLPFDKNMDGFPHDHHIAGTGISLSSVGEGGEGSGGEEESSLFVSSYLKVHGSSLRTLVAMSRGCKSVDGTALLDITIEPFVLMPSKTVKPTASDYHNEVSRQYSVSHEEDNVPPRPKQWSITKCQEWLDSHPIVDGGELFDLEGEIEKYKEVAKKAALDRLADEEALNGGKNWTGKYPMLRMMHAVVDHDEIKRAYITRHDLPAGRIGVENRNTCAAKEQNVWQLIANKWNDPDFSPSTNSMNCHSDYYLSEVIGYETVCGLVKATPEKVEDRWGGMVLALNRIIKNWKKSGQGDGGFEDNPDADPNAYYGELANASQEALDNRVKFIKDGKESYLLYFWELIDNHGLLASAMQKLNDRVSATNGAAGVPSAVARNRRNDSSLSGGDDVSGMSDTTPARDHTKRLAASINEYGTKLVAAAQIRANSKLNAVGAQIINDLRGQKRDLVRQIAVETIKKNKTMVDVLTGQMAEIDDEIRAAEEKMAPAVATPVRNNRTPPT